jgi:hypothetical protein
MAEAFYNKLIFKSYMAEIKLRKRLQAFFNLINDSECVIIVKYKLP